MVPFAQSRGKSFTLIAAIDSRAGMRYYESFEGSNNNVRFKDFFEGLLAELAGAQATIVLDNLRMHKSIAIKELAEEYKINLLFAPPYSCDFNSIEKFFSLFKHEWRRELTALEGRPISSDEVLQMVGNTVRGLDAGQIRRIAGSNLQTMIKSLHGEFI